VSIGFVFRGLIRTRVLRRFLGDSRNGHWRFFAEEITETRRCYHGHSLILETEIETKSGAVRFVDFRCKGLWANWQVLKHICTLEAIP
jgi:hypothetical protein